MKKRSYIRLGRVPAKPWRRPAYDSVEACDPVPAACDPDNDDALFLYAAGSSDCLRHQFLLVTALLALLILGVLG